MRRYLSEPEKSGANFATHLGEQEDEQCEGDSRCNLETKRESPLEDCAQVVLLDFIGDNGCHQGTDTETELL